MNNRNSFFENIEKGEKAVSVVHSPLKVKKKKTTILQQPQKTYMSPKSNKTRPKNVIHASRTQINSEELAIGSVTPGKRQLTGATEFPKPILHQKSLLWEECSLWVWETFSLSK